MDLHQQPHPSQTYSGAVETKELFGLIVTEATRSSSVDVDESRFPSSRDQPFARRLVLVGRGNPRLCQEETFQFREYPWQRESIYPSVSLAAQGANDQEAHT